MSKIKAAVVGAGNLARMMHYPSLQELDSVDFVACCDLFEDKARALAETFEVPHVYTDYKQMVAEQEPDAVWVIMPPQHLYEPVWWCLQQGKHVFIEKPPAMSVTQIRNLAKLAEAKQVKTMCGFNRRHTPLVVEGKRRVEERGPIELASVTFAKTHQVNDPLKAGEYYDGQIDILRCDAIHALDLVRFLCGGECENLTARVRQCGGQDYPNSWQALMEFDTGAVGILIAHWMAGTRLHHAEFHAPAITCYTEFEVDADIWADSGKEHTHLDAVEVTGSDAKHKTFGFFRENEYFVECLLNDTMPSSHFGDAVKTMELVDLIYQAGGWI